MSLKRIVYALLAIGSANSASAATIVVYTDPMTLDRQMVVVNTKGPDRAFLCMAPPAAPDCIRLKIKRS